MLKEDGNFCAKFFKSSDLSYLYVMMKQVFKNVYVVKPQSSRASSAEAFVVGLGFLGDKASEMTALSSSIKTMQSVGGTVPQLVHKQDHGEEEVKIQEVVSIPES